MTDLSYTGTDLLDIYMKLNNLSLVEAAGVEPAIFPIFL